MCAMNTSDEIQLPLGAVLLPPQEPVATGSPQSWVALERRLGTSLPTDYKWFVSTYGAGRVEEFVWILSPFSSGHDYATALEVELADHRSWHEMGLVDGEPDGLIPWARNEDRGTCFWDTSSGEPDRWTIVQIIEDDIRRWPDNMTTFLLKVIRGEHISDVFSHLCRYEPPLRFRTPTERMR